MKIVGKEYKATGDEAREKGILKHRAVYITPEAPTDEQRRIIGLIEEGLHGNWHGQDPYREMIRAENLGIVLGEEELTPNGIWRTLTICTRESEASNSELERRTKGVERLCHRLATTPAFICDPMLRMACGMPFIDPARLEKWMTHIGKRVGENESLKDALARHFGKEIADLAESLL